MLLLSCLLVVGGNSIHGSFGDAFVDRQAPPLMHIGSRSLQPPMKLVENDFPAHVTGTLRCACNAVGGIVAQAEALLWPPEFVPVRNPVPKEAYMPSTCPVRCK